MRCWPLAVLVISCLCFPNVACETGHGDADVVDVDVDVDQDARDTGQAACQRDEDCVAALGALGPCQRAACDQSSGRCVVVPAADGTACEDDDRCTVDTVCAQGLCGGPLVL